MNSATWLFHDTKLPILLEKNEETECRRFNATRTMFYLHQQLINLS